MDPTRAIGALWRAHRKKLAMFEKKRGKAVGITPGLAALGASIDAFLGRQSA
ncbi:MAG TPA: hypothetical protein VF212_02750 [Longimicrobiales bacterium]